MGMSEKNTRICLLWNKRVDHNFNVLLAGAVFRDSEVSLITGCDDGVIRLYRIPPAGCSLPLVASKSLETKSGPIQTISLHNIMKFASNDLITGDSRGMLTVFSNGQILSRQMVSDHSLNCLQVSEDATGAIAMVCADSAGNLYAALPYNNCDWKIRMRDIKPSKVVPTTMKSLLSVSLPNSVGQSTSYILACDNHCHLYIIQQGSIVLTLDTPSNITAMCAGRFLHQLGLETPGGPVSTDIPGPQVALASEAGGIYLFSNFELYQDEYANAGMTVSRMCTLPSPEPQEVDSILCAGHGNAFLVFNNAKEVACHTTPDWVNSITVIEGDSERGKNIIIGCMDNTIQALRLASP